MIEVRPFASLGAFRNDWLNARHHFSFGQYHDPKRASLGTLRVWNDDEIGPDQGFGAHPHRDMEIITYVRQGAITHRDNLGNIGRTEAGDVQVMHAGTGITHAEFNQEPGVTKIFQIWLSPNATGVKPGWAAKSLPKEGFFTLASGDPAEIAAGALPLHADGTVQAGTLAPGQTAVAKVGRGRVAYVVPSTGAIEVNAIRVSERDGAAISDEEEVTITAITRAEIVLVTAAASPPGP